jgi:transcriptional regulator GlxA family with amidase domain
MTMPFIEVGELSTTQSSSLSESSGLPFVKGASGHLPRLAGRGPGDMSHGAAAQPSVHRGGLPPRALRRVREFIESHLEESISIQALAAIVGLSMCHFARAFKQSEGVTPHDYVLRRRVKRVQELLADTDLPLSEIAIAVGFADQSHCARRFREHVGLTPSRYRWSLR